ncbi:MAG: biotin--[acetyl-CoA-carboxylase] ligase [Devosiaceae bacterium]|nr:biotin--[acetyl-CoA-carboxylase] ligase [Devosiaceae bacterium MH13]
MDGVPHHHLGSVDSTITQSWRLAGEGAQLPFWLTADVQIEGRGRASRSWASEAGNLYSTYVADQLPAAQGGILPFAVSLAVHDTLSASTPPAARKGLQLKWPNDVLHEGSKMAGILIEQRVIAKRPLVAIGVGINVEHAPVVPGRKTASVTGLGGEQTPGEVFQTLRERLAARLKQLRATTPTVLEDWSRRAIGVGQPVKVEIAGETCEGTFDHLAADGALMLRQSSGAIRAIRAGDVFVPSAT